MNMTSRRGFFKSASTVALAATATPALAYQAPITETPEPDLPEWWKKLIAELQQLRDASPDHLGTGGKYIVVRAQRLDAILEEAMGGLV
ncbi:hypothetical protein KU6B_47640 [Mameliella alba]|uniref:hypothetical protein n=1 Tax=Mameliella alba TaxID=561184 RepID=UPI0013E45C74|nr:hypothetical protein [Mameliella alba]BBU58499.1 hypothetical protein KU6B_47640 [Mameliella alba]